MLRTTLLASCNRTSSAATVLSPNNQGLCAARPAGVPPRRQGALFDSPHHDHYGRPEIRRSKMICVLGCRSNLDATLHHCSAPSLPFNGAATPKISSSIIDRSRTIAAVNSHISNPVWPHLLISLRDACEVNDSCPAMHAAAGRRAERGRSERDYDEGHATCFRDIP